MLMQAGKMLTAREQIDHEETLKGMNDMKMRWNDFEDCLRTILKEFQADCEQPHNPGEAAARVVSKLNESLAVFTGRGDVLGTY